MSTPLVDVYSAESSESVALPRRPPRWPGWLREPLLHFVLLGGLLFAIDHVLISKADDPHTIVVGAEVDSEAIETFQAARGRPPNAEELAALAHREIAPILGIREEPAFTNVTIWPRAIPQYNLGHTARIVAIETTRAKFPGLFIAGNYLTGPAVGVCVERAMNIANEIRVSFAN